MVSSQATQKGDPVTTLKRQLEEKEKQLATEQEDASAARNKLRELTKVRTAWSPAFPAAWTAHVGFSLEEGESVYLTCSPAASVSPWALKSVWHVKFFRELISGVTLILYKARL